MSWFGPWFPDAADSAGVRSWFGSWFPDRSINPTLVPPTGPGTVATLVLTLLGGFKVKHSFASQVIKHRDGSEQRIGNVTLPFHAYSGQAFLAGNTVTADRALLARYAASGRPFLLGLAHEALPISGAAAGTVIPVTSTAYSDWCVKGWRVVVLSADEKSSAVGVIQAVGANSITLDIAPGAMATFGTVMPGMPVFLDAQQSFTRGGKIGSHEVWNISARAVMRGYESGANVAAAVALSGYTPGALHNAFAFYRQSGSVGNGASLTLAADSALTHGQLATSGQAVTFHYKPATTTVQDLLNALASGSLIALSGSLPATSTALQLIDAFGPAPLAGGTDKSWGTMGAGGVVNTYQGRSVWDRVLEGDAVSDSMQSMVELVDLGGAVDQIGPARQPDWGRGIKFSRLDPKERQWLLAFMYAVNGCRRAFWLASWRKDLTPIQLSPGTLKIDGTVGDFFGWYPAQRSYLQVQDSTGAVQYVQITSAVDNGDGTFSLSITSSNAAYNTGGGGAPIVPTLVSWLDLCRFESNDFEIAYSQGTRFAITTNARAVQA